MEEEEQEDVVAQAPQVSTTHQVQLPEHLARTIGPPEHQVQVQVRG
jgi:hypothetical protein